MPQHGGILGFRAALPGFRSGSDRPWLGRGGYFYEAGQSLTRVSLHDAGELAVTASEKAVAATRRTVLPFVNWMEGLRRTGSLFGILLLAVISALVLCAALAGLVFVASVVFAPQLQMLSHILFFTPLT